MRRGVIVALSVMGGLLVILAVALATVGTGLDKARIDRDNLQFTIDDLNEELQTVKDDRGKLQKQAEDQQKAMAQLKTELERAKAQAQAQAQSSQAPSPQPSASATPDVAPAKKP